MVWPKAAMVSGTTMGILRQQLAARSVSQRDAQITTADLSRLTGAVVMNSWAPAVPITELANHCFVASDALADVLRATYDAEPWLAP